MELHTFRSERSFSWLKVLAIATPIIHGTNEGYMMSSLNSEVKEFWT